MSKHDHDHDPQRRAKFFTFVQELNPDIDPQSLRLMDNLRMTSHAVYRAGESSLAESGISYARYRLLMHLLFAEEIDGRSNLNPSEISDKQGISRNTVSSLIRELENEGLIERHLDEKDRRRFNIRLTENGRLRVHTHASQHFQIIADSFSSLTADEQQTLAHLLNKINEKLD